MVYTTEDMGFSLAHGVAAFAFFSGSMLISGILAGNLIDHLGAARIMIISIFLNGIILFIIPAIHNYYMMIMMCVLWGGFVGMYRPAAQTFVSYLSIEGKHKITFSIYRLANNLGMSIGPAIGGYIALHSFHSIFFVNAFSNILGGVILLAGLLDTPWINYFPATNNKKIFTLKWLKNDATLRVFIIGIIPVFMVFFQHESTLGVYLQQNLHLPLSSYGWIFTVNTLMIVCFELLLNIATINWPYRINFIIGSLLITAGFAGIYFATAMWHIILLTMVWTLGEMILYPSASSYIADIAPEKYRGGYMSLFSTSANLGMLLGPWGGGLIMQQLGGQALWITCSIFGGISILIFLFLPESNASK